MSHGADDGQQDGDQSGRLREGRERRHRLRHGHDGREGGQAVEGQRARIRMPSPSRRTRRRCAAIAAGHFKAEISPYADPRPLPDLQDGEVTHQASALADTDEGPRPDQSLGAPGQAAPGVRRPRLGHGRQQLADVRRRRCRDAGVGKGAQGAQPDAAGALCRLLGGRRAAGDHGHRPDRRRFRRCSSRPASARTTSTGSS